MNGQEALLYVAATATLPTVRDVRSGAYTPRGRVSIVAVRNGQAVQTEPELAAAVQWERLLPDDCIVELPT